VFLQLGNVFNGEIFFRPARQIFAGIMVLFQENLAQQGGKRAVIGHVAKLKKYPRGTRSMNGSFHQILSQLRKKRRVSQRKVASDLYISQALLSHYENGIREPGLDFVNRVCEYYDVTADFLLGRSPFGGCLDEETADDTPSAESLCKLLQMVESLEDKAIAGGLLQCYGAISYRLLRHMAALDTQIDTDTFKIPLNRVAGLSDLVFYQGEMQLLDALEKHAEESSQNILPEGLETLLAALDNQMSRHLEETV